MLVQETPRQGREEICKPNIMNGLLVLTFYFCTHFQAQYIRIGKSSEGKDLFLLKVGMPSPRGIRKPAVWIDGGVHARLVHTLMYIRSFFGGHNHRTYLLYRIYDQCPGSQKLTSMMITVFRDVVNFCLTKPWTMIRYLLYLRKCTSSEA